MNGKQKAVLAAVATVAALAPATAAATAPAGRWTLTDGAGTLARDGSGQGNDGVLSSTARWTPGPRPGVAFDGASAGVTIPQSPALEPAAAVTVSAWVRNTASPGPYSYIVAKGAGGCTSASWGIYSGPGGGAAFYVAGPHAGEYVLSPQIPPALVWDGRWHQLTGSYDGHDVRLSLDGVQVPGATPDTAPLRYSLTDGNTLIVGAYGVTSRPGCQAHGFPGVIDVVDVFPAALAPREIADLYLFEGALGDTVPTQAALKVLPTLAALPGPPVDTGTGPSPSGTAGSGTTTGPRPGPGTAPVALPRLTGLTVLAARGHGRPHRLIGLAARYRDSAAASTELTLLRAVRHGRQLRWTAIGRVTHGDRRGVNTVLISRIGRWKVTAGRYRLTLTPRLAGRAGRPVQGTVVLR